MKRHDSFEQVESKMMRSLDDLYSLQALLKSTHIYCEKENPYAQECLKYQAQANEYRHKWEEANKELEFLQTIKEQLKRYELDCSTLSVQLNCIKQENIALKETVGQLKITLNKENTNLVKLEHISKAVEQELIETKQILLQQHDEMEIYQKDAQALNDSREKCIMENISEIERLQDVVDKLKQENGILENSICHQNAKVMKSRIPVRSISLCSFSHIDSDIPPQKKNMHYQQKLTEAAAQNKLKSWTGQRNIQSF